MKQNNVMALIVVLLLSVVLVVLGLSNFVKKEQYSLQKYSAEHLFEVVHNSVTLPTEYYTVLSDKPVWTKYQSSEDFGSDSEIGYYAIEVRPTEGSPYIIGLELGDRQTWQLARGTLQDLHGTLQSLDTAHAEELAQYANGRPVCGYFLSSSADTPVGEIIRGVALTLLGAAGIVLSIVTLLAKK